MKRKLRRALAIAGLATLGVAVGGVVYVRRALSPMPKGATMMMRFESRAPLRSALRGLEKNGIIRDANAVYFYALLRRTAKTVPSGTHRVASGVDVDSLLRSLQAPFTQMVRLPETNWAKRNGALLEKAQVARQSDYLSLSQDPAEFKQRAKFPLPETSLEGYLYPDTYELPPLIGAKATIERQLDNFQKRAWIPLQAQNLSSNNIDRVMKIASLVQLEVSRDKERSMVAGVIENRLRLGMPLQIDASINYGLQVWRPLKIREYKEVQSPYNLYLHRGLPPTPICSPSVKSIEAALKPAKHEFLYYVALPSGQSLFAKTFEEHRRNILVRKKALAATPKANKS